MASPLTFRALLPLRLAVMAAAAFWGSTVVLLVQHDGAVAPGTLLSAGGFLVFFLVFSAHYGRMAITVTVDGIVVSRFFGSLPVPFDDIVGIEVHRGLAGTIYEVLTRRGLIHFSSLLARHRELFDLLRERAELQRGRR
jgi:hypothetical protein